MSIPGPLANYPFFCIVSPSGKGCAFLSEVDEDLRRILLRNNQTMFSLFLGDGMPKSSSDIENLLLSEEIPERPISLLGYDKCTYHDYLDETFEVTEEPATKLLFNYYSRAKKMLDVLIAGRKFVDPRPDSVISVIV